MSYRELWGVILRDWEENSKKKAKLIRQLVYQGIPEHMRGMAWQCLSGAHNRELRDKYPKLITVCASVVLVHGACTNHHMHYTHVFTTCTHVHTNTCVHMPCACMQMHTPTRVHKAHHRGIPKFWYSMELPTKI